MMETVRRCTLRVLVALDFAVHVIMTVLVQILRCPLKINLFV